MLHVWPPAVALVKADLSPFSLMYMKQIHRNTTMKILEKDKQSEGFLRTFIIQRLLCHLYKPSIMIQLNIYLRNCKWSHFGPYLMSDLLSCCWMWNKDGMITSRVTAVTNWGQFSWILSSSLLVIVWLQHAAKCSPSSFYFLPNNCLKCAAVTLLALHVSIIDMICAQKLWTSCVDLIIAVLVLWNSLIMLFFVEWVQNRLFTLSPACISHLHETPLCRIPPATVSLQN